MLVKCMRDCWRGRVAFFGGVALAAPLFYLRGGSMARKIWLVILTLITVAFVASLLAIGMHERKQSVWLSEQEADELFWSEELARRQEKVWYE